MLKPDRIRPTVGEPESLNGEAGLNCVDSRGADSERQEGLKAPNLFLVPDGADIKRPGRRYFSNGFLSAAVIALALLLGWLAGRAGWNMAVSRAEGKSPNVPDEVLAAAQATPYPLAVSPPESAEHAEVVEPDQAPVPLPSPVPKPKVEANRPDSSLVMYEHGKVVFRAPATGEPYDHRVVTREDKLSPSNHIPETPASNYLLTRVVPKYPEEAKQKGIQGPVVMKALVGTDGSVQEVKVMSGDAELVPAAVEAVQQWRFQPHLLKGNPVEFETQVTLNFSLP